MKKKTKKWIWPLADLSWNTELIVTEVTKVLRSGRVTMGAKVEEFEAAFAKMVGAKYAVMTNSGSSANLLAVAAINEVKEDLRGTRVLVPAIAWSTTYSPLQQYGAELTVVDAEAGDVNVNMDLVEEELALRQHSLVVGVSILGYPAQVDAMRNLAVTHGAAFWEDNCESLGASINTKQLGTFGDVGTYSTFFSHQLNTIEGGVLVTDDVLLADAARCMRAHGWTRDLLSKRKRLPAPGDYSFIMPGYNVRPTEIQAVIGLVQLKLFDEDKAQRQRNWDTFRHNFDAYPEALMHDNFIGAPVPFGFILQAKDISARFRLIQKLLDAGIECRMVTGGSFNQHPAAKYYPRFRRGDTPNADLLHHTGVFVGNHPRPLDEEFAALEKVLNTYEKSTKTRRKA